MPTIRKLVGLAAITGAFVAAGHEVVEAAVIRQSSIEEASNAELIVLAVVSETRRQPSDAIYISALRAPFYAEKVRVSRYLKGSGPEDLVVLSEGGQFEAMVNGTPTVVVQESDLDTRLPAVGTKLVMFLDPMPGLAGYHRLTSISHGALEVLDVNGVPTVTLLFADFERLSPEARVANQPMKDALDRERARSTFDSTRGTPRKQTSPGLAAVVFPETVRLDGLPEAIGRAAAAPSVPRRHDSP